VPVEEEVEEDEDDTKLERKKDDEGEGEGTSGAVLWMRGLTRLHNQIRVMNAFKVGMPIEPDSYDKRSLASAHSQLSLTNARRKASIICANDDSNVTDAKWTKIKMIED